MPGQHSKALLKILYVRAGREALSLSFLYPICPQLSALLSAALQRKYANSQREAPVSGVGNPNSLLKFLLTSTCNYYYFSILIGVLLLFKTIGALEIIERVLIVFQMNKMESREAASSLKPVSSGVRTTHAAWRPGLVLGLDQGRNSEADHYNPRSLGGISHLTAPMLISPPLAPQTQSKCHRCFRASYGSRDAGNYFQLLDGLLLTLSRQKTTGFSDHRRAG